LRFLGFSRKKEKRQEERKDGEESKPGRSYLSPALKAFQIIEAIQKMA